MTDGVNTFVWIAFAVFSEPAPCDVFMEAHKLYEGLDWQCVIHDWRDDKKLAPDVSLRPRARPTQ